MQRSGGRRAARAAAIVGRIVGGVGALLAVACQTPHPGAEPLDPGELAPFVARVEQARGLRFAAPVVGFRVPPAAVERLLEQELDRVTPPEYFARQERLYRAIGLWPEGLPLRREVLAFQSGAVAGFYAPAVDRLFVVGGRHAMQDEAFGVALVHELDHALQAQHGRVLEATLGIDVDGDLLFGLSALLEGDATWTEQRDAQERTGVEPASADAFSRDFGLDVSALLPQGVPRWLWESVLRPYPLGYALVRALVDRGGAAALDAALQDPPLSSADVLHPERYLAGGGRRGLLEIRVDPGAELPGCRVAAEDSLGELGLRVWALDAGAPQPEAEAAAEGWDGDRAWLLDCPFGEVTAWIVFFASERDAGEFAALARGATSAPGGLVVRVEGARVLLEDGIPEPARSRLLATARGRRFPDFAAWLAAHPEVMARAQAILADAQP